MAFVVRNLTEAEYEEFRIGEFLGSGRCAVDEERDAILVNRGGGGRNESPDYRCEFRWKGYMVTFRSPISGGKNHEGINRVYWSIKHLNIPPELRGQEQELKQLMKEAIIAYGQNGLTHLPVFKYDVLVISGLDEQPFKYVPRR